jgi:1-acyl-sn-glycerol-3-phosphate acyltransferase
MAESCIFIEVFMSGSVFQARLALACLWISQTARVMADHCLRVFVVLLTADIGTRQRESAWHIVAAIFAFPCIALAPFNGACGNSLPKRTVLVVSSVFCLASVMIFQVWGAGWLYCAALVAVGAAAYSPTRYALLPAAAKDACLPLSRVNAFIEMGAVGATVSGLIWGGHLYGHTWGAQTFAASPAWLPALVGSMPAAIAWTLVFNVLAGATAWRAFFPSDVRRQASPGSALAGFFQDTNRVLKNWETRGLLMGTAAFRGLVAVTGGAVVAEALHRAAQSPSAGAVHVLMNEALWILLGIALGALLAGLQGHPRRMLGIVPFGSTGLFISLLALVICQSRGPWLCITMGVMVSLINIPLMAGYQRAVPADARGNGLAVLSAAGYVAMGILTGIMGALAYFQLIGIRTQFVLTAILGGLGTVLAWRFLLREALEQLLELILFPMYRIRAVGPGLELLPSQGPLIIVANHSSWLDPIWLGKPLPRRLIPMMTSEFYDLPVLRFLMTQVVHAIRVPAASFRREAPELQEAVAVLDRDECLVVFPEGRLRRRADQPLRQFGQGIWHILRERPKVPVAVCWIEGGWGSYFSYRDGPPMTNKRLDWSRAIEIAVAPPEILRPELLEDQRKTRRYLMEACIKARSYLVATAPSEHNRLEDELATCFPHSGDTFTNNNNISSH